MAFKQDESKLVSIFIQTLLYGVYVATFSLTHWVLVHRRTAGETIKRTMMGISLTMFVLATMHIGVNFARVFMAFIKYRDEPGGPAVFFDQLSEFTQIFGTAIYVAQTLVGDAVVLLRCYIVWERRWYVAGFPLILLLGSTASGIGILYTFARVTPHAQIFAIELQNWIVSFFSLTLATNLICTALVASRVWYINRSSKLFSNKSLTPVVLLVIESGAIYSATLIALLILYKVESWFQYVLLDAISPIVGLVFSMIIIRIGLGIILPNGQTRFSAAQSATLRFHPIDELESRTGSVPSHATREVEPHGAKPSLFVREIPEGLELDAMDIEANHLNKPQSSM
ncbi:hypothetical protein E1B28_004850 [Marasmius oreades]|uniref:Uncharacterized protein n=1 Tax=Marasmius oreades TaxID=181124 RepID=A0A9P7UZH0_9AGAR|nr:uncharacterized protein E1B28_004850 [Marasmius oreades]KAG7097508.1 hypothetical protein E1B28_004850 [Marasmius oreades]